MGAWGEGNAGGKQVGYGGLSRYAVGGTVMVSYTSRERPYRGIVTAVRAVGAKRKVSVRIYDGDYYSDEIPESDEDMWPCDARRIRSRPVQYDPAETPTTKKKKTRIVSQKQGKRITDRSKSKQVRCVQASAAFHAFIFALSRPVLTPKKICIN